MNTLFDPIRLGRHTLRNRLIMAPMTRSRADDASGDPSPLAVQYYAQRAGAGLIVTEGTFPSAMGKGYVRTPGIATPAQVAAWRQITDAVHAKGGVIFLQLMHCGRISHPSLLPAGATPVAPSAIAAVGKVYTATGPQDLVQPRALDTEEIPGIVAEYRRATRLALEAGFDGVELHAASGYLPEQFLSSETNQRTDQYGGSLVNRARFILDVLEAMTQEAGGDRVGIKIAPEMDFNSVKDAAPETTYSYLVQQLAPFKLAYLHIARTASQTDYCALLRPLFAGTVLHGGGLDAERAQALIESGQADGAVFGGLYLANPDLAQRLASGAPLNAPVRDTFFSPGAEGYIDYPFMEAQAGVQEMTQTKNRALRIHRYGGADVVSIDAIAVPQPAAGEVLVRVHAAGVNGLDWKIRDGILQEVFRLPLPATLGIELAGEVIGLGAGVTRFAVGDRVMGALGTLGGYADIVAVAADKLALTPAGLNDITAAAIPVTGLTAWQALFEAGGLQRGQIVLIHGAAGGVGGFAVQLAKQAGARVIATAQGKHAGYVRELGADEVIDYRGKAFWDIVSRVDLVLDLVGGAALSQSWQLLSDDGVIVSTAAPEILAQIPDGKRGVWFQMRPDADKLAEIAQAVADRTLTARIAEIVTLEEAAGAIERNKIGHEPGKTVVRFR